MVNLQPDWEGNCDIYVWSGYLARIVISALILKVKF